MFGLVGSVEMFGPADAGWDGGKGSGENLELGLSGVGRRMWRLVNTVPSAMTELVRLGRLGERREDSEPGGRGVEREVGRGGVENSRWTVSRICMEPSMRTRS